jgi:hypothetical protein
MPGKRRLDLGSRTFESSSVFDEEADGPIPRKEQMAEWVKYIIEEQADLEGSLPDDWTDWDVEISGEVAGKEDDPDMDWSCEAEFELTDPDGHPAVWGTIWVQGHHPDPRKIDSIVVHEVGISAEV